MTPQHHFAHHPGWSCGVATLLVLVMLGAFHQVIRGAVRQGDLRRETTALQTAALFRCKALHERHARDGCFQAIDATPTGIVALRARNALTVAALEQLYR